MPTLICPGGRAHSHLDRTTSCLLSLASQSFAYHIIPLNMADRSPTAMASQRGGQNLRGGRRREDPASNQPQLSDANHRGRGFRGVRGERRGQKRGRGDLNHNSVLPDTHIGIWNGRRLDQAPNRGGLDSDLDAERINQGQIDQRAIIDQKKPEEEGEVCFICASTIDHLSIAPCNHQTCHICALRLRALYKKRDCAYCKVSITYRLAVVKNSTDNNRPKQLM